MADRISNPIYKYPFLKPFVEFVSKEGRIVFLSRPGRAVELDDPSGFINATCRMMNPQVHIQTLKNQLRALYANEVQYLDDLLVTLDQHYLLEDAVHQKKAGFSEYDLERWKRSIEFFGAYCKATENKYSCQRRLHDAKVTLLGIGGVGSHVLYDLAAMGVRNIRAVDFDTVELSNLNRQIIYNPSDIGQLKTEVAKKRILEFLPDANLEFVNQKIGSAHDIFQLVEGQDIVISVLDQPRDKIIDWLNEACFKAGVGFICGSFDSQWAAYYTIFPGVTGCVECWKQQARAKSPLFLDMIQDKNFTQGRFINLAISPLVSTLAGLLLSEVLKMITGIAEPISFGKLCVFDFLSGATSVIESWQKTESCHLCAH